MPRRFTPWILLLMLAAGPVRAQEVQHHGLVFEQWIRDTFFDGYRPESYTQRWDIPASANRNHGGIPVNPKAIKYGTAVDLGDALRQFSIDEPFLLIVGFWRQSGESKIFVNLAAVTIKPEQWRRLWGPITLADLQRYDALIKDRNRPVEELRAMALRMKSSPPFNQAIIQMNPKIDTHGQRRLQCSLRFNDFFDQLAPTADRRPQDAPTLWGIVAPGAISSKIREFSDAAPQAEIR